MEASSPENISDLIAKPQEEYPPEPRYVSKYREKIIEASKRGKSAHRTMGVPPMDPDMPAQYLKQRNATEARWKALSKPSKSPEREKRSSRREQKVLPPKKPPKAPKISRPNRARRGLWCVDDRHGNSYPVMLSGMFPVYRNREGFGKVPGTYAARSKSEKRNTLEEVPSVVVVERRKSHKLNKSPRRGGSPGRTSQQLKKKAQVRRATKTRERSPKARETRTNKRIQDSPKKLGKNEQSPKRSMVQKKVRHSDEKKEKRRSEAARRETVHRKVNENLEADENEEERSLQHQDDGEPDQNSRKKKKQHGKDEGSEKRDESTSSESEVESKGTRASDDNSDATTSSSGSSKSRNSASSITTASTVSYHQPRCRYVDEDERAELLYGMKKKWDEMMKKFQCLPFVTDTQPKKKRKSQMEKELLQLEKDIKMIEAHPYIYVYSDPED